MNIPNVCMRWATRWAECRFCEQRIEKATPVVVVFFWNKGQDGRKWNTTLYYHPDCWVAQGLDYLKMNPYVAAKRWSLTDRRENPLTVKEKEERNIILRKKASLDQRKRNLKTSYPDHALLEARIDVQISELMLDMLKVGGIPKKWLE